MLLFQKLRLIMDNMLDNIPSSFSYFNVEFQMIDQIVQFNRNMIHQPLEQKLMMRLDILVLLNHLHQNTFLFPDQFVKYYPFSLIQMRFYKFRHLSIRPQIIVIQVSPKLDRLDLAYLQNTLTIYFALVLYEKVDQKTNS